MARDTRQDHGAKYGGCFLNQQSVIEKLKDRIGQVVGVSDWLVIDQKRIDPFAECTEASSWVTLLPHEETTTRPDSVGLPVPVVRLRIVDAQNEDLPSGKVGEILIKGPNIFKGY